MVHNQIRQSSLILGSGPGALTVLQDGTTVLIPGIDAWYVTRKHPIIQKIPPDVMIRDARLEQNLGVDYFVVPPAEGLSEYEDSSYIDTIMFPKWLICYSCNSLVESQEPNRIKCAQCSVNGKKSNKMIQTNFVVACEDGHLNDFPWSEWVHRGQKCTLSNSKLSFHANGVVQLSNQKVVCSCGKRRDLSGTSTSNEDGTTELSKRLAPNETYKCTGGQPWLLAAGAKCDRHIRMVLRSSNNIYFANTISSILVPSSTGKNAQAMERIDASNHHGKYLAWLLQFDYDYSAVAKTIKMSELNYYEGISEAEIAAALHEKFPNSDTESPANQDQVVVFDRSPEWSALTSTRESGDLVVRSVDSFNSSKTGLTLIHAVPLLKKTTALQGFTRIKPKDIKIGTGKALLRRNPFGAKSNWLPAIRQTGEGIFLSLDQLRFGQWSEQDSVSRRMATIEANLQKNNRETKQHAFTEKYVLLHTLSHVLIQELVIDCGYTSASLAERIYSEGDQAGILIYTASAAADGTMGGLVEMSHPPLLLKTLDRALERARWCSNDPVCMELGYLGQGNAGSNLAACQNCCLLPETACESFNQFLDRALLIGDITGKDDLVGFFDFEKS